MNVHQISKYLTVLSATLVLLAAPAMPQSAHDTVVQLLKVGPVDVDHRQALMLERGSADLLGITEGYQNKVFQAFVQPSGQSQWIAGPWSNAEPGSYFQIPGVTFPGAECRLVVAVFDRESPYKLGSFVEEAEWRRLAVTQSEIVTIRTATADVPRTERVATGGADVKPVRIVSIDGAHVGEGMEPVTKPSADVVIEAKQGSRPYLSLNVPGTNRCHIYGPGAPDGEPERFLFRNVLFTFPGIPEQMHVKLFVVEPKEPIQTGDVDCGSLDQSMQGSRTVEIVVGPKDHYVTSDRVSYVAITGLGGRPLTRGTVMTVHDGESVEALVQGLHEGSFPVVVVRQVGTHDFLPAGEMMERATRSSTSGTPAVVWILPATRFMAPMADMEDSMEFEITIVLTNSALPCAWLDGAFLSNRSVVEGLSEPVRVRVTQPARPFKVDLSIVKVGDRRLLEHGAIEVRESGPIEIEARGDVSQPFFVYVMVEQKNKSGVQLIEAMRSGNNFYIPRWVDSTPAQRQQYVITAFSSLAPISSGAMDYAQLIPHVTYASEPRTIVLDADPSVGAPAPEFVSTTPNKRWNMQSVRDVAIVLCFVILALIAYERFIGGLSELAGLGAERLVRERKRFNDLFEVPDKINPGRFLLGIVICAALFWAVSHFYIWTYAEVIRDVTGFSAAESLNLGVYFLIALAILGILLEQLRKSSISIRIALWTAVLVLFSFQGLLYFDYFYRRGGFLAPVAFLAGLVVPVVDALGMYFVSFCVTAAIGCFFLLCLNIPVATLEMLLKGIKHAFDPKRRNRNRRQDEEVPSEQDLRRGSLPRSSEATGD